MNSKALIRAVRDHPWVLGALVACARTLQSLGWQVPERVFRHLPYRGLVTVETGSGRGFRMRSRGGAIENGLFWRGIHAHEPESTRGWLEHAGRSQCVLDIGANSGVFALAAAAAGARDVHAFEPLPRVHAILLDNISLNPRLPVQAWQLAVGDESGTAQIYDPGVCDAAPTSASLSLDFINQHFNEMQASVVEVITVDDFCASRALGPISLVKLDVEGFEDRALRGMRGILLRDKPHVLMEVLPGYEERLRKLVDEILGDDYEWLPIREGDGEVDRNVWLLPRG